PRSLQNERGSACFVLIRGDYFANHHLFSIDFFNVGSSGGRPSNSSGIDSGGRCSFKFCNATPSVTVPVRGRRTCVIVGIPAVWRNADSGMSLRFVLRSLPLSKLKQFSGRAPSRYRPKYFLSTGS